MAVSDASLLQMAHKLRRHSSESASEAGSGHPTSCMSCAEIVSVLFFDEMRYDPADLSVSAIITLKAPKRRSPNEPVQRTRRTTTLLASSSQGRSIP